LDSVKYRLTDKESVLLALQSILSNACSKRKPSISLDALRLQFAAEAGVPFGHCNCGSLISFLQHHPQVFKVTSTKDNKHHKSQVSLLHFK